MANLEPVQTINWRCILERCLWRAGLYCWLGGAKKPVKRRGLLLITSVLLILSVVVELVIFRDMLGGAGFIFGVTKRIVLGVLATAIYFYSFRNTEGRYST